MTVNEQLAKLLEICGTDEYGRSMDLQAAWSGHLDAIATMGSQGLDEEVEIVGENRNTVVGKVQIGTWVENSRIMTAVRIREIQGEKIEETPAPKPKRTRVKKDKPAPQPVLPPPADPAVRYACGYQNDAGMIAMDEMPSLAVALQRVPVVTDQVAYIFKLWPTNYPSSGVEKIYIWVDEWVEFDDPDFIPF